MARLSRDFYLGDTVSIARNLLGMYLVRVWNGTTLAGRITETEAYVGRCDKACHAYGYHRTERNSVLFGEAGHAYIYLIYGMHCCLNLVTEPVGEPSAVLIRALEPAAGIDAVRTLRFGAEGALSAYQRKNFLNGPGKVCQGFALTKAENGMDLTGGTLFVCETAEDAGLACPAVKKSEHVCAGPRVGVDYAQEARDFPWRFRLLGED